MKVFRAWVEGPSDGHIELIGICADLEGAEQIIRRMGVSKNGVMGVTFADGSRRYVILPEGEGLVAGYSGVLEWETPEEIAETGQKIAEMLAALDQEQLLTPGGLA